MTYEEMVKKDKENKLTRKQRHLLEEAEEIKDKRKRELFLIWYDGKTIAAGLCVILPLIGYALFKVYGDCFTGENWESIKYLCTGPLLFLGGVMFAPVWITAAFFLVFAFMKFLATTFTVIWRWANKPKPIPVTKDELIDELAKRSTWTEP